MERPQGEVVPSCTILTTEANDLLRPIHNRMPATLPREREGFWLDRDMEVPEPLADVLNPYPADLIEAYEVSSLVNSYVNDGPQAIEPVAVRDGNARLHP